MDSSTRHHQCMCLQNYGQLHTASSVPVFAELWIVSHSITSACVRRTMDSSTQHNQRLCSQNYGQFHTASSLSLSSKTCQHQSCITFWGLNFIFVTQAAFSVDSFAFLCRSIQIAAECFRQNIPTAPAHAAYCAIRWLSQYLYPATNGQHNTGSCKVKPCNKAGAPSFGEYTAFIFRV
jgi:hypothetical protein